MPYTLTSRKRDRFPSLYARKDARTRILRSIFHRHVDPPGRPVDWRLQTPTNFDLYHVRMTLRVNLTDAAWPPRDKARLLRLIGLTPSDIA